MQEKFLQPVTPQSKVDNVSLDDKQVDKLIPSADEQNFKSLPQSLQSEPASKMLDTVCHHVQKEEVLVDDKEVSRVQVECDDDEGIVYTPLIVSSWQERIGIPMISVTDAITVFSSARPTSAGQNLISISQAPQAPSLQAEPKTKANKSCGWWPW